MTADAPNRLHFGAEKVMLRHVALRAGMGQTFTAESYRDYAGDGVFRLSVGLEDPEDLIADLEQVL